MKTQSPTSTVGRVVTLALAILVFSTGTAEAQQFRYLDIGSLRNWYVESGTTAYFRPAYYGGSLPYIGLQWPALWPHNDYQNHEALYMGATNFTDERGDTWDPKVVTHRVFQPFGAGGMMPVSHEMYMRFPLSDVTVDGAQSFSHVNVVDEIDPSIPADQMVVTTVNSELGLTMTRRDMAWGNEFHDNYHLTEIILENTGNTDADPEIELPNNTLTDVVFTHYMWRAIGLLGNQAFEGAGSHGRNSIYDVIGYGDRPFTDELGGDRYRGVFGWDGNEPLFSEWDDIGSPVVRDLSTLIAEGDTTGRISAPGFIGRLWLHVDESVDNTADDTAQPSTMAYWQGNGHPSTGAGNQFDQAKMSIEYEWMTQGRQMPHHADVLTPPEAGESWYDQMARQEGTPNFGFSSGNHYLNSVGPYDMAPGETIRFVYVTAVNGLDRKATLEIGAKFKQAWLDGDEDRPLGYDANSDGVITDLPGNGEQEGDETLSKNRWVLSGKDSLFQTYHRAFANYESDYSIPDAPLPPSEFHVNSRSNLIQLEWDTHPGAQLVGFEIYRMTGDQSLWAPELIAEVGPEVRSYQDADVTRGLGYYYHIVAVGAPNTDGTGLTPTGVPLRSSLYATQTYTPAYLQRAPGSSLDAARIVPNPYDLGADPSLRFPDVQDRIAFLDIPGNAEIEIYTEMGERIYTIDHSNGSGDTFWDLTTSSNQLVVSGIYLAVITDRDSGERAIKKFVIIR